VRVKRKKNINKFGCEGEIANGKIENAVWKY